MIQSSKLDKCEKNASGFGKNTHCRRRIVKNRRKFFQNDHFAFLCNITMHNMRPAFNTLHPSIPRIFYLYYNC